MLGNHLVRTNLSPDESARAVFHSAAFPPLGEHNPALVRWGDLRVDPDLAGLAIERALPSLVELVDRDHDDTWKLPVAGVLETRLAWHPTRPLVAGLAIGVGGVHVWVADRRTRTVEIPDGVRAATSLTSLGPDRGPLVWIDDSRLAVVTVPGAAPNGPEEPPHPRPPGPTVYEATGPGFIAFEPDFAELSGLAGAAVSVLDLEHGSVRTLTSRLLIRGVERGVEGPSVVVEYLDDSGTRGTSPAEFAWSAMLVDLDGHSHPIVPPRGAADGHRPRPEPRPERKPNREPPGHEQPERMLEIPTGPDTARLWVWNSTSEQGDTADHGVRPLWVRVRRPGTDIPVTRADTLAGCGGATLDFPMHWPVDASLPMLHAQIVRAVQGSLEALSQDDQREPDAPVVIGGHSFGATITLYALAHVAGLAGGIAHSGCYNRTLTPTGFHFERRSYWQAPEIYRAFSALLFADRIERPLLILHGTDDTNPATTPEQAVQLYRGIIATGGHARLALLPYEGHSFRYQENRDVLVEEHRSWLCRLRRRGDPVGESQPVGEEV